MAISINGNGITSANIADGAITNADITDVAASKLTGALPAISGAALTNLPGGGKVLQVVNFSTNTQGNVTLSTSEMALSPSIVDTITPIGSGSKFLIQVRWAGETDHPWGQVWNILRDGTRVNVGSGYRGLAVPTSTYGNDYASTPEMVNITTLDTTGSTAGTAIVFKLVAVATGSYSTWTNRTLNGGGEEQFSSEIIITEIGA